MTQAAVFCLTWLGFVILVKRVIRPALAKAPADPIPDAPLISIVIPARNEENNLPPLLDSLQKLTYPRYEVIVIDDQSTDRTEEIAKKYPVVFLKGEPLPEGWNGKNWVCHQASKVAKGEYFLFTDADTKHEPDVLERALSFMLSQKADLMSAIPYHENPTWWEQLTGPFHALILTATRLNNPSPRRLFAIGQFLFFSKEFYSKCGGHAAVHSQYPDDLALANLCYEQGGRYAVYYGKPLFRVRMYLSFREFIQGWRRNFSAGVQQSNWTAFVEVVVVVFAIVGGGHLWNSVGFFLPAFLSAVLIAYRQEYWGKFSFWGPFLFPFSILLYTTITLLAVFDYLNGNALVWKGRVLRSWTARH